MKLHFKVASLVLSLLFLTSFVMSPAIYAVTPDTAITSSPSAVSTDPTPTFEFTADQGEPITFECSIDEGPFSACSSPLQTPTLDIGAHIFEVKATNGGAETDASPAVFTWEIISSEITTCEELINIDDALDGDFELMNDLDCVSEGNDAMIGDN